MLLPRSKVYCTLLTARAEPLGNWKWICRFACSEELGELLAMGIRLFVCHIILVLPNVLGHKVLLSENLSFELALHGLGSKRLRLNHVSHACVVHDAGFYVAVGQAQERHIVVCEISRQHAVRLRGALLAGHNKLCVVEFVVVQRVRVVGIRIL